MQDNNTAIDQKLQEKVMHGDLSFPMKVYLNDFTTYVAENIPWHWHGEIEFVVVTQGTVLISVGMASFVLEKGNGLFINANTLHQMKPIGEEKAYMFSIVTHPCILGIEKGFLLSSKYVEPYITNDNLKYQLLSAEIDWQLIVIAKLQSIYNIFMGKEYGYEYILHNLICEVWFTLVQRIWSFQTEEPAYKDLDESRIYLVLQYIHNHYTDTITLADMCQEINVSKSECCRCFKRKLKMTPFEYLMLHRITMAAKMLESTNETITEISLNNGFNSNSYFCKLFRSYLDCSPMEYRKSRKKKVEEDGV